ncbi:MAG: hypothetical protein BMS9Abin29_2416 [Gemmatimonadota bacterium]|nr:MAG: hypothetical protein BMS9Abin29_2416 [Gemmatimonadota bacterium]
MKRRLVSPSAILLGIAFIAVVATFIRNNRNSSPASSREAVECPYDNPRLCSVLAEEAGVKSADMPEIKLLEQEVCVNVGYLCANVEEKRVTKIHRWPDDTQTLTVRVPLPDFEPKAKASELQRAAVRGIQAWQGHPFGLAIQTGSGGGRTADIQVVWSQTLGGRQIGVARTEWSWEAGKPRFEVLGLRLTTRAPSRPTRYLTVRQVSLVAAHEMGHALGLPHSDATTDVMYRTNTANRLSTRDYRTMEAFYRLPNGAEIYHDP